MSTAVNHKLPGEFVSEGITFNCLTTPETLEKVKTFPLEAGDVVLSCYPKGGTVWNLDILQRVMSNDTSGDRLCLTEHMDSWLELDIPVQRNMEELKPGPKMLFTHLGFTYYRNQVAEGKAKFIVPMRNLKDNLVSLYHFYRSNKMLGNFSGTWDQFFCLLKQKRLLSGDWLDFNLSWWNERHRENVHIVFYEDLKSKPAEEIRKIAEFCGKNLSDEVLAIIVEETSFEVMKKIPLTQDSSLENSIDESISPFMRKGQVGDWKNYFTPEQIEYINEHYEPKLKAAGLIFKDQI